MKLLLRISIILGAAAVVVAVALGLAQTSWAAGLTPTFADGGRPVPSFAGAESGAVAEFQAATDESAADVTFENQPPAHGDHQAGGLRSALDIVRNLGIIVVITLGVVLLGNVRMRRPSVHNSQFPISR